MGWLGPSLRLLYLLYCTILFKRRIVSNFLPHLSINEEDIDGDFQEKNEHRDTSAMESAKVQQTHHHEGDPPTAQPRTLDEFFQTAYDNDNSNGDYWKAGASLNAANDTSNTTIPRTPPHHFFNSSKWQYSVIIGAIGISSAADASEMFSLGYILGIHDFQTHVLKNNLAQGGAIVAGIINIGLVIGGIVASAAEGYLLGRRATLIIGLSITTMGGILCTMSSSVATFATCRFIVGFGIGAILSCSSTLVTELSPPKQRGFIVSVNNAFWTVGMIWNAILAYLIFGVFQSHGWRLYAAFTVLPSIIGLLLVIWVVPESPRYLALQGKYGLATLHANHVASSMGYKGPPLEESEIEHHYSTRQRHRHEGKQDCSLQSSSSLSLPSSAFFSTLLSSIRLHAQQMFRNVKLIYTSPDLCKPAVTLQLMWISVSIGAALAFWINTIFQNVGLSNVYLSFIILNCASIPGNMASAVLTDRMGRNKFFSCSCGMASMALFAVGLLVSTGSKNEEEESLSSSSMATNHTISIVFCTAFYYASMTGVYSVLYVMASELYPTTIRATGVVLSSTFGRIAQSLAQFVNGALIDHPSTLLNVGATVLLSGALVAWIVPPQEMSRKPVKDDVSKSSSNPSSPSSLSPSFQLVHNNLKEHNGNDETHSLMEDTFHTDVDESSLSSSSTFRRNYSSTVT